MRAEESRGGGGGGGGKKIIRVCGRCAIASPHP